MDTARTDPFGSSLRLYLSVDIVGSTAFKQSSGEKLDERESETEVPPAAPWFSPIAQFYKGMDQAFAREWAICVERAERVKWPTGDSPELWKSIGDELVYTKRLTDNRQVLTTLNAWMRAVSSYRKRLLEQFKSLDLKSTAWIAGFPIHNAEVFFRKSDLDRRAEEDEDDAVYSNLVLLHQFAEKGIDSGLVRDYIGPAIDTGFRLGQLSTPRKLVISVEMALLLIKAIRAQPSDEDYGYEKPRIFFDGRQSLKGVFGGLPYPIFWVDMRPSPSLEESEDKLNKREQLNTDEALSFCQEFIKANSPFCFTPYIEGNPDPDFTQVPEQHQRRLEGLRAFWERESAKRQVEKVSTAQKEGEPDAAGTRADVDVDELAKMMVDRSLGSLGSTDRAE